MWAQSNIFTHVLAWLQMWLFWGFCVELSKALRDIDTKITLLVRLADYSSEPKNTKIHYHAPSLSHSLSLSLSDIHLFARSLAQWLVRSLLHSLIHSIDRSLPRSIPSCHYSSSISAPPPPYPTAYSWRVLTQEVLCQQLQNNANDITTTK